MHLYRNVAMKLTAGVLVVSAMISPAFAAPGAVNAEGGLRLRQSTSTSSAVITTLPNQSAVEVLGVTESGWYLVSAQNATGYVFADYVTLAEGAHATLETVAEPRYGRVVVGPLNVRSGPGTDYGKVTQLSTGAVVQISSTVNGWYQIDSGYVSSDYVAIVDASEAANSGKGAEISAYAQQFLGCRYVYGGSSPSGFDCSGFAQYIYKQFGYSIARTASDQMNYGVAVSIGELQPGDLVFFNNGSSSKRATHVGIYIGTGNFIHASTSSTGVIISAMNSAYYTTGFVGGRRFA